MSTKSNRYFQESVTDVLARTLMSQSTTNESPTSRSIAASTTTTDGSGPFPMKPRSLQSPNSVSVGSLPRKSPFRTLPIDPVDDSENLNPDDIQQSLRTTANAIQVIYLIIFKRYFINVIFITSYSELQF
jgi:hypothetical protein